MAARSEARTGWRSLSAKPAAARSRSTATFATLPARRCRPPTSPKASNGYCRPMAIDCGNIRRARPLLGTCVEIQASGASRADVNAGIDAAFDAVAKVHRLMSFHEPDSDVSRLNQSASSHPVSVEPWTYEDL